MQFRLVRLGNSPNLYVEWREAGAKKRVSARTSDPREAEAFLVAWRLEYSTAQPEAWPTVPEVLDWYYEAHASKKASAIQARIAIKHLKAFFGSTSVVECRSVKHGAYEEHRRAAGVANETVRRELSVLSAAFRRAFKKDKLPGAPPAVSVPEASDPRDRYLERDEVAQLFRHLHRNKRHSHLLLFSRLALYTGARSSAILQLTWDRVDLERGVIRYRVPGVAEGPKARASVPISPRLIRMLEHAKRRSESDHVITWAGEPVVRIVRAFRRQADDAKLPGVTAHTLRHTFGTWATQGNVSLFLVARAMGHKRTSTTERYAKDHVDPLRVVTGAVERGARRGKRPLASRAKVV